MWLESCGSVTPRQGALLLLLPLALGLVVTAQERGRLDTPISAGVYTAAQALRGQANFENNCSECHMSDLSGRAGPALKGESFMEHWRGKTVANLVEKIKTTMPADQRAQLTDAKTLDIVAFLLQGNGFAPGDQELNAEMAARIKMAP
jgi:mono/diheme cytochrome c family protein